MWRSNCLRSQYKWYPTLYVDFRLLNTVTERDAHPIPPIEKCIDFLGETTIFSRLDKIVETSKKKFKI